jgi:hypothetical protein
MLCDWILEFKEHLGKDFFPGVCSTYLMVLVPYSQHGLTECFNLSFLLISFVIGLIHF